MRMVIDPKQRLTVGAGALLAAIAGGLVVAGAGDVLRFVVAGLALAAMAAVIGQAIEAVGEYLGPGATQPSGAVRRDLRPP
jgi:hypothetical protein